MGVSVCTRGSTCFLNDSYGGPKVSQQIQFAHGKFNLLMTISFYMLTAISIWSQQFQIWSWQFQYFNLLGTSHGHSLNRDNSGWGCIFKMAEDETMLFESLFYEGYEYQEIVQILPIPKIGTFEVYLKWTQGIPQMYPKRYFWGIP